MRLGIKEIDFINQILKHPTIYHLISDDFCPAAEDFTIENTLKAENVHIISPNKHTVVLFLPKNGITWEIHYNVLTDGRGETVRDATKEILDYAFTQIPNCKKLICYISEQHQNVINFALEMGMKHEGRTKKSLQKNGKLYDELLLGMRRKEWQQQQ